MSSPKSTRNLEDNMSSIDLVPIPDTNLSTTGNSLAQDSSNKEFLMSLLQKHIDEFVETPTSLEVSFPTFDGYPADSPLFTTNEVVSPSAVTQPLQQFDVFEYLQKHIDSASSDMAHLSVAEGYIEKFPTDLCSDQESPDTSKPQGLERLQGLHATHDPEPFSQSIGPSSSDMSSADGVPEGWNSVHDKLIAYLATHAPLDKNGNVPAHEDLHDRYKPAEIARMVMQRFPSIASNGIKVGMIENRLALLEESSDGEYFKVPYGAYKLEEWGQGV